MFDWTSDNKSHQVCDDCGEAYPLDEAHDCWMEREAAHESAMRDALAKQAWMAQVCPDDYCPACGEYRRKVSDAEGSIRAALYPHGPLSLGDCGRCTFLNARLEAEQFVAFGALDWERLHNYIVLRGNWMAPPPLGYAGKWMRKAYDAFKY